MTIPRPLTRNTVAELEALFAASVTDSRALKELERELLELTRFHGHIIVREEGVRNESTCL